MPTAPTAGLEELTEAQRARLPELVAAVLTHPRPQDGLLAVLEQLDARQDPALAAALHDAVGWRVDLGHYWVYYRLARVFSELGPAREDAAFIMAASAVRLRPDWLGSVWLWELMFGILQRRGQTQAALDLFAEAVTHFPELPPTNPAGLQPLLDRAGAKLEGADQPPAAPDSRVDRAVYAGGERPAWSVPTFGGPPHYCLRPLATPRQYTPVSVAELPEAEVLLSQQIASVIGRDGTVHMDLSVSDFPYAVRRKVERLAQAGERVPVIEAEEAVLILDRFPVPNLSHFLLDQISRLAVYERAGVNLSRATVIGPVPQAEFQRRILRRAGVTRLIAEPGMARVRARRLWVSSNCRDLWHPAHLAADWAIGYLRAVLGGRGTRGWRRLYVSRADVPARQVVNEREVLAVLEPHGFERIVPGEMPYEEQLAAFRQASHVIGPHGAALTHLLLCPPDAQVLEMFHPLYGTFAFALTAAASGLRYAALIGRDAQHDTPEWNDPNLVDVTRSQFLPRHMRIDLDALRDYLATAL